MLAPRPTILIIDEPVLHAVARGLDLQGCIGKAESVERLPREALRLLASTYGQERA